MTLASAHRAAKASRQGGAGSAGPPAAGFAAGCAAASGSPCKLSRRCSSNHRCGGTLCTSGTDSPVRVYNTRNSIFDCWDSGKVHMSCQACQCVLQALLCSHHCRQGSLSSRCHLRHCFQLPLPAQPTRHAQPPPCRTTMTMSPWIWRKDSWQTRPWRRRRCRHRRALTPHSRRRRRLPLALQAQPLLPKRERKLRCGRGACCAGRHPRCGWAMCRALLGRLPCERSAQRRAALCPLSVLGATRRSSPSRACGVHPVFHLSVA